MNQDISAQDNSPRIRIPATLFCIFTPSVVATRFWSRRHTGSALGSDDWTILGSMMFELADSSVLLAACSFGFGKHSSTLTLSNYMMALKLFYTSQILYKISLNLTKASILLLYLRAFTIRPFQITCWILMVIVVTYAIAATVGTILQCNPLARAWDKTITGSCFDITAFWYANASYTIATDVILLVLPARVIWALQLRKVQKVAVLVVFALGGVVTICSIIRMTTLAQSSRSSDPTYDIESTSWANIESNIAILCACLPIFRRPLALLFPRSFSALGDSPVPVSKNEGQNFSRTGADIGRRVDGLKGSDTRHGSVRGCNEGVTAGRESIVEAFELEHVEFMTTQTELSHHALEA